MARKPAGLFITGSDTGVGKTYVAALIARALYEQGHTVGVYKPVATGCRKKRSRLVSDDAEALWKAAGRPGALDRVCPQMFRAPLAPHLAAAKEGRRVDAKLLRTGVRYWQDRSDFVLIEGAGGLMSPITEDEYNADLAYDLAYSLVVVVPNRIGAINQALQTLITAATFKDGLSVAGVVLNQPMADSGADPSVATNMHELATRSVAAVLAEVQYGARLFESDLRWKQFSQVKRP
ncbi:MAG: dethiobiotin synthase [Pirellulales bacterium]